VLTAAGIAAGVDTSGATLIRDGSQVLYRLPTAVVARIGRHGQADTAAREVLVSRWLADSGVPAVRTVSGVEQPTLVEDRAVTWWYLIPEHRPATPAELGTVLHDLHALPIPTHLHLPEVDPLRGLERTINTAAALFPDDHDWLLRHLEALRTRLAHLPAGLPRCVVHGDAWQGNTAVPTDGTPVLLDLECAGVGRPEWDLITLAADLVDFARITTEDYNAFVHAYGGVDVTAWGGFRTLADVREFRWVSFAIGKSATTRAARREAAHRISCLRGRVTRPWTWSAL
jgi:aminoglycoside phosphotransferase (APT) family kinase protein